MIFRIIFELLDKMYKFSGVKNIFWYKYMKKTDVLQYFIKKARYIKLKATYG